MRRRKGPEKIPTALRERRTSARKDIERDPE